MATKIGPEWLNSAVFYEIYPQSFYDANGDGIGDLAGIMEKLDHISYVGCNAIWINPCFVSPFRDAGYDVSDYYRIAPRYGTNEDMARLLEKAHAMDIKVCLDFVPGHTSIDHPWFVESGKPVKNKYSNWYIWTDSIWEDARGRLKSISGLAERDGQYVTNFFYSQPALNYGFENPDPEKPWQLPIGHPDVQALRREMETIMRFWLDMGVDGFRVDMAMSLVKEDPEYKGTIAYWQGIRRMLDREYPHAALIAEWSCPPKAIEAGFHSDFLLSFGDPPIYNALFRKKDCFFSAEGRGDIGEFLASYMDQYIETKEKGYISIPTGNHDTARISRGRTMEEIEMVFACIMTMPGVPFVYYGDEIGMRFDETVTLVEGGYNRTGSRTPMQWTDGANAGFSAASADKLYLPVDGSDGRPTVEGQMTNPDSLLNRVRALINLRHAAPCLWAGGEFEPLYARSGEYPFVYMRKSGEEQYLIALNPYKETVTVTLPLRDVPAIETKMGNGASIEAGKDGYALTMAGVSYGIFKITN